ncbi:MAG: hypothetical protein ABUS54_07710 [Actinomycetota bacterium]
MTTDDLALRNALDTLVPLRDAAAPDWSAVLRRALDDLPATAVRRAPRRRLVLAATLALAAVVVAPVLAVGATHNWWQARSGGTVPEPVFVPVRGRPAGWVKATAGSWFVVYVKGGQGACGYTGASWRIALVETATLPARVVDDRAIGGAMCGNRVAWVRSGRFSDGKHDEVAFQLWQTPSLGATTYVYRVDGNRLTKLATFPGDTVTLKLGTAVVTYENPGRSPHGEREDTYRFANGSYRLVSKR